MNPATLINSIKNKILISTFVTITFLSPAFGDQTELVVGVSNWPPWKINTPEFGGIDVLILKQIEKRLNINLRFIACPWKRCLESVKTGDVDIVTSFVKNEDRVKYVYFIEPSYHDVRKIFYKKKDSPVMISKYDDLYAYVIGVTKGGLRFPRFENDNSLRLEKVSEEIQLLRMLKSQRVDAIIGSEYNLDYLIIKNGFQGMFEKIYLKESAKEKTFLAMSKKSKHVSLIPKMEQILREMVETKQIETIINNYFRDLQME